VAVALVSRGLVMLGDALLGLLAFVAARRDQRAGSAVGAAS
jgi:hypothetical protein